MFYDAFNVFLFSGFGFQGGFRQAFQPFIQPVQSFNSNVFQPFMQGVMHMVHDVMHGGQGKFVDDGTESPQVTIWTVDRPVCDVRWYTHTTTAASIVLLDI